jgi:hypothetical protein
LVPLKVNRHLDARHLRGHHANFPTGGASAPLRQMEALASVLAPAGTALTEQVSPLSRTELRRRDSGNHSISHPACACLMFYPSATREFESGTQRRYCSWGLFATVSNEPGDMVPGELPSGAQPHIRGAEK